VPRLRLPAGRKKRIALYAVGVLVGLFVLAQAIPYGRHHSDPRVTKEPAWDSSQTRSLAARACFDCHSNLTSWPWYSNVAPNSWLIQRDVDSGRSTLNFSEWDRAQDAGIGDIVEAVGGGGMPPWYYRLLHPRSRLSKAEKAQLVAGLQKTLQVSPPIGGGG
jgi:mono/diheme cytochrome c family protein